MSIMPKALQGLANLPTAPDTLCIGLVNSFKEAPTLKRVMDFFNGAENFCSLPKVEFNQAPPAARKRAEPDRWGRRVSGPGHPLPRDLPRASAQALLRGRRLADPGGRSVAGSARTGTRGALQSVDRGWQLARVVIRNVRVARAHSQNADGDPALARRRQPPDERGLSGHAGPTGSHADGPRALAGSGRQEAST